MTIYLVRAKDGRHVVLPGASGKPTIVPTTHEASFPVTPQLIRERDVHGDLDVCREFVECIEDTRPSQTKSGSYKSRTANQNEGD